MYSQKDSRWKNKKLGFGNTTIGGYGCAISAFSNFMADLGIQITPDEMNEKAKKCGAFSGDMLNFSVLAKELGFNYRKDTASSQICIAETNYYKNKGVPQHFFLYNPITKRRVDSLDLDPKWEDNNYNIVSYRILIPMQETITPMRIIDLSHWNKVNDWTKLKNDFIIHKCTEGATYLDPTYNERKDKIQASYHFANGGDPIKEADWFIKNSNEPMLILDWEINHKTPTEWCKKFIDRVKEKTGKDCWFYTNNARARKYQFPGKFKWIARYKYAGGDPRDNGEPDIDYEPLADWDLWQFTSNGKVEGIEGRVDINIAKPEFENYLKNEPISKEKSEVIEGNVDMNAMKSLSKESSVNKNVKSQDEVLINNEVSEKTEKPIKQAINNEEMLNNKIDDVNKGDEVVVADNKPNNNNMETLKAFFTDKKVKTFAWNAFGTFLGIVAIYLTDINSEYAIIIVPAILAATKFINQKYL